MGRSSYHAPCTIFHLSFDMSEPVEVRKWKMKYGKRKMANDVWLHYNQPQLTDFALLPFSRPNPRLGIPDKSSGGTQDFLKDISQGRF